MKQNETRLLFLGTGAADWPEGAPQGRAFSSALVDGRILIDCTQRCIARMREYGVDPNGVTDVFITHGHSDHFSAAALVKLAALRTGAKRPLTVRLDGALASKLKADGLVVRPLAPGKPVKAAGYAVLPLEANHAGVVPGETPLHYLFTRGDVRFLYATDGAWMTHATWRTLCRRRLDAWIVDCTIGHGHRGDYRIFEHNTLEMVRIMAATLRGQGVLKEGASVVLTHLARSLHPDRRLLESKLKAPFVAAYDGYGHVIGGEM